MASPLGDRDPRRFPEFIQKGIKLAKSETSIGRDSSSELNEKTKAYLRDPDIHSQLFAWAEDGHLGDIRNNSLLEKMWTFINNPREDSASAGPSLNPKGPDFGLSDSQRRLAVKATDRLKAQVQGARTRKLVILPKDIKNALYANLVEKSLTGAELTAAKKEIDDLAIFIARQINDRSLNLIQYKDTKMHIVPFQPTVGGSEVVNAEKENLLIPDWSTTEQVNLAETGKKPHLQSTTKSKTLTLKHSLWAQVSPDGQSIKILIITNPEARSESLKKEGAFKRIYHEIALDIPLHVSASTRKIKTSHPVSVEDKPSTGHLQMMAARGKVLQEKLLQNHVGINLTEIPREEEERLPAGMVKSPVEKPSTQIMKLYAGDLFIDHVMHEGTRIPFDIDDFFAAYADAAEALTTIHKDDLIVHKDFHKGNVLIEVVENTDGSINLVGKLHDLDTAVEMGYSPTELYGGSHVDIASREYGWVTPFTDVFSVAFTLGDSIPSYRTLGLQILNNAMQGIHAKMRETDLSPEFVTKLEELERRINTGCIMFMSPDVPEMNVEDFFQELGDIYFSMNQLGSSLPASKADLITTLTKLTISQEIHKSVQEIRASNIPIAEKIMNDPLLQEAIEGYKQKPGNPTHEKISLVNSLKEGFKNEHWNEPAFQSVYFEAPLRQLETLIAAPSKYAILESKQKMMLGLVTKIHEAITSGNKEDAEKYLNMLETPTVAYAKEEQKEAIKELEEVAQGWSMSRIANFLREQSSICKIKKEEINSLLEQTGIVTKPLD